MSHYQLPDGWAWHPLGSLVRFERRNVSPEHIDDDTPYVGLEHISAATGQWTSVPAQSAGIKSAKFRFSEGDLLYGKLRPNLRKCALADRPGVCSTDILPLTPADPDDAGLLSLVLRSEQLAERVAALVGGANLPRVNVKDLLATSIPVPPPPERHRLCQVGVASLSARRQLDQLAVRVEHLEATVATDLWYPDPAPASEIVA